MQTICLLALIAARTQAYDANFRNDAEGLRSAIVELGPIADDHTVRRMALYYLAWTEWALAPSEMQAGRTADALAAARRSVGYSHRALEQDDDDPEVLTTSSRPRATRSCRR